MKIYHFPDFDSAKITNPYYINCVTFTLFFQNNFISVQRYALNEVFKSPIECQGTIIKVQSKPEKRVHQNYKIYSLNQGLFVIMKSKQKLKKKKSALILGNNHNI